MSISYQKQAQSCIAGVPTCIHILEEFGAEKNVLKAENLRILLEVPKVIVFITLSTALRKKGKRCLFQM